MKTYQEFINEAKKLDPTENEVITEDAQDDFIAKLDLKKTARNINKVVKAIIKVDPSITLTTYKLRGRSQLSIESKDLADKMKPKMFKELLVDQFSQGLNTSDGTYWLSIHYAWTHFNGGSNGSNITELWINQDGSIRHQRDAIK